MNTYLIRMYFVDQKVREVVINCKKEEIDDFTKKEVENYEKRLNERATDVIILMKVKDFR